MHNQRTTIWALLEEGSSLFLQGFHLKGFCYEESVDVLAIPDEPTLACAIEGYPQR